MKIGLEWEEDYFTIWVSIMLLCILLWYSCLHILVGSKWDLKIFPLCNLIDNIFRLEMTWQLIFVAFVEDAFFYWAHRLAHSYQFLYKYHKIHHEYTEVFSLVTEYTHPIDYIVGILVTILSCRFLLPFHLSF